MDLPIEQVKAASSCRSEFLDLVAKKSDVLATIAQSLRESELDGCGLDGGASSAALFFFEMYKRLGRFADLEHARSKLAYVLDSASELIRFDLYQGLAGVGWLLHHLRTLDTSCELQLAPDCCSDVDEILTELVKVPSVSCHYDLVSGLVGIGVYAVSHPDSIVGKRLFEYVIDRLIETSESDKFGITWRSQNQFLSNDDERALYPNGNFNLGIAHGIPGVIALLGKGLARGYDAYRCAKLLRQGISWLLAATDDVRSPIDKRFFNHLVGDATQTRIAWCYGDLSVAIALLCAARGLNDDQLYDVAIELASGTLNRSVNASGVRDASLCHGSQGNAHIYRRLFQWTKRQQFLDACYRWECATVAPSILSPESAGGAFLPFKFYNEWKEGCGYLMGLSGIGLSLADGLYGLSGRWDVPLMTEL